MMDKKTGKTFVALLHDIGRIAVRANLEKDVWQASKILVSILDPELEILFDKFIKELGSKNSKAAVAHRLGGSVFGDESEPEGAEQKSSVRLKNPFSSLKLFNILEPAELFENYRFITSFFPIALIEQKPNIPCSDAYEPDALEIYKNIWNFLVSNFKSLQERGGINLDSVLRILKKYTFFVPAWIAEPEKGDDSPCDFSLYHHLKLTAAAFSILKSTKGRETPFSLIVVRLSGLKNFFLDLSKDAELEDLWGRYVYALGIAKFSALCIVEELGLSSVNIISESGFEFAILSSAGKKDAEILNSLERALNRWFFDNSLALSIRISSMDFGVEEAQKSFGAVWDRANRLSSFGKAELGENDFELRPHNNFCAICLNELREEQDGKTCDFCAAFKELGRLFASGEKIEIGRKLFPEKIAKNLDGKKFFLRGLNDDVLDDSILISAFGCAPSFNDEHLPQLISFDGESANNRRLGALVMGFDNSDILFDPRTSDEPVSLAKAIVILDGLNIFLNHYSNWLAASFEGELGGLLPVRFGAKGKRKIVGMLLSDNKLFMIGSWSDVLELGLDIRRVFRAFMGEKSYTNQFGLSAGFFDAEPGAGWKFLLLKAEELFRLASELDKARSFLVQELSERPEPRKVCDSVIAFLQPSLPIAKGTVRSRISWAELEKDVLPLVEQWRRAYFASSGDSKQLLSQLWNVFNTWRSDGIFAFGELERAVGKQRGRASGEFAKLLDMVYSFASKKMDIFHIPLGWVERLITGR